MIEEEAKCQIQTYTYMHVCVCVQILLHMCAYTHLNTCAFVWHSHPYAERSL